MRQHTITSLLFFILSPIFEYNSQLSAYLPFLLLESCNRIDFGPPKSTFFMSKWPFWPFSRYRHLQVSIKNAKIVKMSPSRSFWYRICNSTSKIAIFVKKNHFFRPPAAGGGAILQSRRTCRDEESVDFFDFWPPGFWFFFRFFGIFGNPKSQIPIWISGFWKIIFLDFPEFWKKSWDF